MNMLPDIFAGLEPAHGANQQSSSCAKIQCRLTLHKQGLALFAALLTLTPLTSHAGNLQLVDSPLFLTNQVKPNIILSIDDSGSMDSEVMLPTNDGALWWHTTDQSFTGRDDEDNAVPDVINFNKNGAANGTWKKYIYLFPNGFFFPYNGQRVSADGPDRDYAIPPTKELAFMRSPDFNKGYYDPDVAYTPWTSFGGTTFGDVDPTNAPWDPVFSGPTPTIDLTVNIDNGNTNWRFRFHQGMIYPDGTPVTSSTPDDKQVAYFPATYYRIASTPDNTGYLTPVSEGLAPDGSTMAKYEIKPGNYSTTALYNAAIQNFANWISYYRRRHLAMRAGMGKSFEGLTALRAGLFTINNRVDVTMWDMATQSDTFYSNLYSSVGRGITPNRQALDHAGKQYARPPTDPGAPITEACQQNYTIAFTDGFTSVDTSSGAGNADGGEGVPYQDDHNNTLADIAMKYYKTNPRPDLLPLGSVPTSASDKNADLHMVTYTVGLGVKGKIFGVTHNTVADAFAVPPTWQDPTITRNPIQVDDLYHAAINGRGQLLNATTPEKISEIMKGTLKNIIARTGTASSVAATGGVLTANSRVYQAKFTSGDWSGDLSSVQLDIPNSQFGVEDWRAGEVLKTLDPVDVTTGRQIITWDGADGIPFRWASLPDAQKDMLRMNPVTGSPDPDPRGEERLNYLRGDHSKEGDPFRIRDDGTEDPFDPLAVDGNFVLGDIIDSGPVFVGVPPFLYPDDLEDASAATKRYSDFRGTQASRIGMVYVGANDGMLHGFETVTGKEKIAYVPSKVFANLNELTDPDYNHRNYVNGSPTYGDAFFGGSWRSVIVGTLAGGGQGVFALDITDPGNFGESGTKPADTVLWEFTDTDDPDLGFTYGQAVIVKTHAVGGNNGKWAAIFGNGYNNTGSGHAVLYIVDIQTGALIHRIDTGAGSVGTPNGLATPAVIDADGDFIADFVFAGDLQGNMWKFDIRNPTPASWKIPTAGVPLFTATDGGQPQPITVQPEVLNHPTGENGFMVYFGTGKYLEAGDNSSTPPQQVQSFYGIWDEMGTTAEPHNTVDKTDLQIQTISSGTVAGQAVRTITNVLITAWGSGGLPARMGFKVDLRDPGEKSVTNPIALGDRMLFTTLIPSVEPCDFGGTGFLMEINIVNGGTPENPVFDLNNDGLFTDIDKLGGQVVVGVNPDVGLLPQPAIFTDPESGIVVKTAAGTKSSAGGKTIANSPAGTPFASRRSWRQLQ